MKKLSIPVAILVILILVLSGCGTTTTTTTTTTTSTAAPPTTSTTSSTPAATTTTTTTTKPPTTTSTTTTTTTGKAPVYGGTWTLLSDTSSTLIAPPQDGKTVSFRWIEPAMEPLLRMGLDEKLQPFLAESWDLAPDGKSVTFHIRKGVQFHDGTTLNAQAVKTSLEMTTNSGLFGAAVLKIAQSYDIIDDYTLRANLSKYNYGYMTALAGQMGIIASPTALAKQVTDDNRAQLHLVGTGPFIFKEWKLDDHISFTKNANYWQKGLPYLDTITIRTLADRAVTLMSFQAGEADNWSTGLDQATDNLLRSQGYTVVNNPLRWQFAMFFDSANAASPFAKKEVREAIHWGVDKQGVVDGIGGGAKRGYTPLYQMAEPGQAWYVPELAPRKYDLNKAKQMLSAAGYPNGIKTTLTADTFAEKPFLEALQLELKKMGIDATLDIADMGRITALEANGWTGLLHPGFPTPSTIGGLNSRWGDPNNFVSYARPAGWTELWAKAMGELDDNARIEDAKQLNRMDYNDSVTFTWRSDAPFDISHGLTHNYILHSGSVLDAWWPDQVWKEKK